MSKEDKYFDDVIDSRGKDDGLLSHAIAQAKLFSEETLRVFPLSHPDLPQDEIDRMRTLIKSCSFIGFRRGYLQGYADALQKQPALSHWVAYDFMKLETRPPDPGKYFVCRKDGKVHWETWNGSGWAYNEKSITYWARVVPPVL